jgi:hypothetical protein
LNEAVMISAGLLALSILALVAVVKMCSDGEDRLSSFLIAGAQQPGTVMQTEGETGWFRARKG